MSRTMQTKEKEVARPSGTPIWVWVVYAFGILGTSVLVLSTLFTVGASVLGDAPVGTSILGFVVWGGLLALAGGLWIWRRRQGRR